MCLDVLRAFAKEPHSAAAVLNEMQQVRQCTGQNQMAL
jgi:hypothetical protein